MNICIVEKRGINTFFNISPFEGGEGDESRVRRKLLTGRHTATD